MIPARERDMRVEFINPFIESVSGLFSTMLSCKAQRGDIALMKNSPFNHEIVALIGMSGPVCGTVAISFPTRTALRIVHRLLGVETAQVDETVLDAMAEFVNIVAGGAKAKLSSETGPLIALSLPTVVRGTDYTIEYPSWTVWLDVPFTSELGDFSLRVSFESSSKKKEELNHESTCRR
jgi:chemotaxis protein CheX